MLGRMRNQQIKVESEKDATTVSPREEGKNEESKLQDRQQEQRRSTPSSMPRCLPSEASTTVRSMTDRSNSVTNHEKGDFNPPPLERTPAKREAAKSSSTPSASVDGRHGADTCNDADKENSRKSTSIRSRRPGTHSWQHVHPPTDHRRHPPPEAMFSPPPLAQRRDRRAMDYHGERSSGLSGSSHHGEQRHPVNISRDESSYPDMDDVHFGPDVLNLPVGSFAEDSPPRDKNVGQHTPSRNLEKERSCNKSESSQEGRQASPSRTSPPRDRGAHHYSSYGTPYHSTSLYRKSPSGSQTYSSGPAHYYSSAPPSQQRTPSQYSSSRRSPQSSHSNHHYNYPTHPGVTVPVYYPPYPQQGEPQWSSPQPYRRYDSSSSYSASRGQHQEPGHNPHAEKNTHSESLRSSPPATTATPEKPKLGSPFRSPVPPSAGKLFKKSPMYHASPNIGTYGSFGMIDTPGGTIDRDFSPMGPSFPAGFGDEAMHQTHAATETFDAKLDLSRSHSGESEGPVIQQRRGPIQDSPFVGFMNNEFSPFPGTGGGLQGVPRSPLRSERRGTSHSSSSNEQRNDRPNVTAGPTTKPKAHISRDGHILTSPLESSAAKPRKLWRDSAESSGPVRLELGRSSDTQRSLEGINSMMRGQGAPRLNPSNRNLGHPVPQTGYRTDMNTPIKLGVSPAMSGTRAPVPPYARSASKQTPGFPSSSKLDDKLPPSAGKENSTPAARRHPCNCKKSKCLKLYCECFAAEQFCDSCNCADCRNIPTYSHVRDKAIKDTRAKNPNAFKPRISVKSTVGLGASPQSGHNMGCRCKRSECLKKYCECFQAGVMCGNKCKCVDCMNYAGSQKLIDKRRKIKDQRGADFAMRVAEQAWKGQPPARKPPSVPPAAHLLPAPMQSPAATPSGRHPQMPMPSVMHPSPASARHPGPPPPHPHYMHPVMIGPPPMGHMGYSPMHLPHVSPGYGDPRVQGGPSEAQHRSMYPPPPAAPTATGNSANTSAHKSCSKSDDSSGGAGTGTGSGNATTTALTPAPPPKISPAPPTPCTPATGRVTFDAAPSRKKRKLGDSPEPAFPFFGSRIPHQPKTTSLAIFSFLSNQDLYSASLVCKRWNRLAMEEELWKF